MGVVAFDAELPPHPASVAREPSVSVANSSAKGKRSGVYLRRERPSKASSDPGRSIARVVGLVRVVWLGKTGAARTAMDPVPMVTVLVVTAPASVTVAGLKVQVRSAGSGAAQASVAVPLNPLAGVKVSVLVPVDPRVMVRLEGPAATEMEGATTVSARAAEVLPVKFASPAYTAVRLYVPAVASDVLRVATPFAIVPVPSEAVPLLKVTVPLAAVGNVAVRVKVTPVPTVDEDEASMVLLTALETVSGMPALLLAPYPVGLLAALYVPE